MTRQAAKKGSNIDLLWLGGRNSWQCTWDNELNREESLATTQWHGNTITLKRVSGLHQSHAYIISQRAIPVLQSFLLDGYASDSAMIHALKENHDLIGCAFMKGRSLFNLIEQQKPQQVGESRISGAKAKKAAQLRLANR